MLSWLAMAIVLAASALFSRHEPGQASDRETFAKRER
jgi:hypothetical protein